MTTIEVIVTYDSKFGTQRTQRKKAAARGDLRGDQGGAYIYRGPTTIFFKNTERKKIWKIL